ncbi:hypothetical protein LXL04_012027 [Taraxacum kok-saghyz]
MSHTRDLCPNRSLDPTLHDLTSEPIHASVLIGKCRAHPCLNITHMPDEILTRDPVTVLELFDGLADTVQTITHLLQAVSDGGFLTGFQTFESLELVEVRLSGLRSLQAHRQRRTGELRWAALDGFGEGGEGLLRWRLFFRSQTSAVCGPHLQASAAEEVDQTSAVCKKKTASRWSGFAPETPTSTIGAEGRRVAGLKTGDEQRPMVEKDRQQKRTGGEKRFEDIDPHLHQEEDAQTFHYLRASEKQTSARRLRIRVICAVQTEIVRSTSNQKNKRHLSFSYACSFSRMKLKLFALTSKLFYFCHLMKKIYGQKPSVSHTPLSLRSMKWSNAVIAIIGRVLCHAVMAAWAGDAAE